MEELSIEEKAKRYDEAIVKGRQIQNTPYTAHWDTMKEVVEHLFPELKESEDERIRKGLIAIITDFDSLYLQENYSLSREEALAWLEKQGKPVVYNRDNYNSAKERAWNCKSFSDDSSHKSIFMEGFQDGYQFGIHEEKPHRWTRHDEAVRKEAIACLLEWKNKFPSIDSEDYRNVMGWLKDELSIHTEEKQGSQNLANSEKTCKVESKFKVGDWVVNEFGHLKHITKIKNDCYYAEGEDVEWHGTFEYGDTHFRLWTIEDAKDGDILCTYECDEPKIVFILKGISKKHYPLRYYCYWNIMHPHFDFDSEKGCLAPNDEDVKPATQEQRDLLFQKMEKAGYKWDSEKKELKKIEQNPAWTEEDEAMLNSIIHLFKIAYTRTDDIDEKVEFFKSLKSRVQPQPKQEWSEDDKEALRVVTNIFEQHGIKLLHYPAFVHWLKTLPNRITLNPYWKPSDEQMRAFYKYLNEGDKTLALSESILLRHLYNDLKKLK